MFVPQNCCRGGGRGNMTKICYRDKPFVPLSVFYCIAGK